MVAALRIEGMAADLADGDRRFTLEVPGLALAAGEAAGLTGASGTGKTLLLELLGLVRRPERCAAFRLTAGGDRTDLARLWAAPDAAAAAARLRGRVFGFVPQTGDLLPFLSLQENVALTQRIAGRPDARWLDHLLDRLGLGALRDMAPGKLSIGQRQRTAIARALAHRPEVVIADEPTAALDPEAAAAAMGLLIGMAAEGGAAVIVSSHDTGLLARFPIRRLQLAATAAGPGQVVSRLGEAARPEAAA